MSDPTAMLEQEHQLIAKVVSATQVLAARIEAGQVVNKAILQEIVEFMRLFADQYHHGKEEKLLFPLLADNGVPIHGCPIGALTAEHVKGRAFVQGLADAISASSKNAAYARENIIENLRGIAGLYPEHIWKEDYLLFPMGKKILSTDQLNLLHGEFVKIDLEVDEEIRDRLEQFAIDIEKRF